uniref:NADH-ubiquinone oxidoreductase chain 6 n=1 Tax=Liachirus melanospilos TaxID=367195 RepID=W6D6H5_9PLEU|nr:NADH dehydrogenase subunit 6 [Liachirus melanospilos]AHI96049.1 NADH dehydrogenase subunit 6 [Liachirus melanospilos]
MKFFMCLVLFLFILGLVGVASNPSPFFAALGLVLVSGAGCVMLVGHGGSFLSLILFLIYLGGMLVVFAYSAALAAEPYPEGWWSRSVSSYVLVYLTGVILVSGLFWETWYGLPWGVVDEYRGLSVFRSDMGGVSFMYSSGGWMLLVSTWALLLALFVVLELTRGLSRGALRAV